MFTNEILLILTYVIFSIHALYNPDDFIVVST